MGLREKLLTLGNDLERAPLTVTIGDEQHEVFASDLTGKQRIEFEKFYHEQLDENGHLTSSNAVCAKLVQLGIVDAEGVRLFKERKDFDEICKLPSSVIEELGGAVGVISGIYRPKKAVDAEGEDEEDCRALDDDDPHLAGLDPKNVGGGQENSST